MSREETPSLGSTEGDARTGPLPIPTKLAYGVGALGDSIKTFSFTTFLLFYYTTVLGLSGTLLGLAMSIGLVWDAVVDPLIGHTSDRLTLRFGRRHSLMLAGALFTTVGFVAVFNPPTGLSSGALFAWLMVSSLVVRSSNSMFIVPYYALGAELAPTYQEQTSLSGYRSGAVLVGTLSVTALAFLVFLPNSAVDGVDAKFVRTNYQAMGLTFGIAIGLSGLVATFGTRRHRLRVPSARSTSVDSDGLRSNLRTALRHQPFRVLIAAAGLSVMAMTINAALMLHFLTYHAKVPADQPLGLSFAGYYTGALGGVLVWVRVCRRFERQHVYATGAAMSALLISSGYWLIGDGRPLGLGNMPAVVTLTALVGFFGIAGSVVAPALMVDVTARDERLMGRRRDGTFFGIYSFGQQLSSGIAVLVAGALVDRFAGLVPGQVEQSAVTVERLAMVSSLLPTMLLAAAGFVMLRYDLNAGSRRSDELAPTPHVAPHRTSVAPHE